LVRRQVIFGGMKKTKVKALKRGRIQQNWDKGEKERDLSSQAGKGGKRDPLLK